MRIYFDIKHYDEVYDVVVGKLGADQDCFETDDCVDIEPNEFATLATELPHIKFTVDGMKNTMKNKLMQHLGHDIVIAYYGNKKNPHDVCVECNTCYEVLVSAEDYDTGEFRYD